MHIVISKHYVMGKKINRTEKVIYRMSSYTLYNCI